MCAHFHFRCRTYTPTLVLHFSPSETPITDIRAQFQMRHAFPTGHILTLLCVSPFVLSSAEDDLFPQMAQLTNSWNATAALIAGGKGSTLHGSVNIRLTFPTSLSFTVKILPKILQEYRQQMLLQQERRPQELLKHLSLRQERRQRFLRAPPRAQA